MQIPDISLQKHGLGGGGLQPFQCMYEMYVCICMRWWCFIGIYCWRDCKSVQHTRWRSWKLWKQNRNHGPRLHLCPQNRADLHRRTSLQLFNTKLGTLNLNKPFTVELLVCIVHSQYLWQQQVFAGGHGWWLLLSFPHTAQRWSSPGKNLGESCRGWGPGGCSGSVHPPAGSDSFQTHLGGTRLTGWIRSDMVANKGMILKRSWTLMSSSWTFPQPSMIINK